jgi:transcriptional regulator with XRE-family HTH domain
VVLQHAAGVAADILHAFGERLRKLRLHAGLSQEELAHAAGLSMRYVSDVERGTRNLGLRNTHRLAVALGVPLSTLFKGVGERPRS